MDTHLHYNSSCCGWSGFLEVTELKFFSEEIKEFFRASIWEWLGEGWGWRSQAGVRA